jgi:hypothetical protein
MMSRKRQQTLDNYAQNHSGITNFAVNAAATLADPLSLTTAFMPGPGEGYLLGKLGYTAGKALPFGMKTTARLASGAIGGAEAGAPLAGLSYAENLDTGDYTLRQSLLDTTYMAAQNALLHAGIVAPLKSWLHKPNVNYTASKAGLGQFLNEEPLDVEGIYKAAGIKVPTKEELIGGPVSKDVSRQIQEAGRPKDEAEGAGAIWQAYFNVMSERFEGKLGTPEEMYQKWGAKIVKGEDYEGPKGKDYNQYIGLEGFKHLSLSPEEQAEFKTLDDKAHKEFIGQDELTPEENARWEELRQKVPDSYSKARTMWLNGVDPEKIRLATGWFKGQFDKQWRYEISDHNANFWSVRGLFKNSNKFEDLPESQNFGEEHSTKLGDILDHPELYKHYPEAKDIDVTKRRGLFDMWQAMQGWFDKDTNKINITPYGKEPLSTLLHEIQHWIQSKEGFARGGSSETVIGNLSKEKLEDLFKETYDKVDEARQALVNKLPLFEEMLTDKDVEAIKDSYQKRQEAWEHYEKIKKKFGNIASTIAKNRWNKLYREDIALRDKFREKYFGNRDRFKISTQDRQIISRIEGAIESGKTLPEILTEIKEQINKFSQVLSELQQGNLKTLKGNLEEDRAHKLYKNIAGEIEARDVQARREFTPEQRRQQEPYASQTIQPDYDPNDVTVNFHDGTSSYNQEKAKPPFYSALSRGVQKLDFKKAPAEQWIKTIKNLPSIKKEELDWTGVEQWLQEHKDNVSKEELEQFLQENGAKLVEVEHGKIPEMKKLPPEEYAEYLRLRDKVDSEVEEPTPEELHRYHELVNKDLQLGDEYIRDLEGNQPKYGQYVLPGGKNYREFLIQLDSPPIPEKKFKLTPEEIFEYNTLRLKNRLTAEQAQRYNELIAKDLDLERQRAAYQDSHPQFHTGHWDEPNVLAHIRFDERTGPNGEKILHMAEVQSDWHQKGRREGYAPDKETFDKIKKEYKEKYHALPGRLRINDLFKKIDYLGFDNVSDAKVAFVDAPDSWDLTGLSDSEFDEIRKFANATKTYRQALKEINSNIPNAPFKQSWHELALKRMLRYAAENGYDKLSWDTGETNADRFDLSKHISSIDYDPTNHLLEGWHEGNKIITKRIEPNKLADYIGKDAADKLIDKINKEQFEAYGIVTLHGTELKIGGEGMKGFYDKMLVDFMKKYTKKWGAKVEDIPVRQAEWKDYPFDDRCSF